MFVNGEYFSDFINKTLEDFGVLEKFVSITHDSGSNFISSSNQLSKLYLLCAAHRFNNIVTHALELDYIDKLISKLKKIVLHFSHSSKATEKLLELQEKDNVKKPKKLIQYIKTRWNAIYFMIDIERLFD